MTSLMPEQLEPERHLTRRTFLQTTSTTALGTTLLSSLGLARSVFAASSDTLKIALMAAAGAAQAQPARR